MLLSYRDIAKHQAVVPWKRERQVEQDLLLCLAMQAIFTDGFLSGQVAMRGGTLLHKVHLAPAARYSEDIDLVVHGDRPEGHIEKALRRVLLPVLGKPVGFGWESVKLAIRNAVQPSRVLRLIYSVPNVSGDGPALDIVVEANVTERVSYLPVARVRNLADWLISAREQGAWSYGAAADAPTSYRTLDLSGRVILVLGGEGRGLRPRVAESCDGLISIPIVGRVGSLNVSVAAAVLSVAAGRAG